MGAASALVAGSETVMSEAAHLADRLARGGRHRRGIPLAAAGPVPAAFRACPIGHLAIRLTTQP